ncbi:hypothetical protein LMH73_018600 [Vibrio splendidus]|nr:hypothetical protein [Vibrio splendidus]MCC4882751.1 hypothetical protein [Vibrio splendidus]
MKYATLAELPVIKAHSTEGAPLVEVFYKHRDSALRRDIMAGWDHFLAQQGHHFGSIEDVLAEHYVKLGEFNSNRDEYYITTQLLQGDIYSPNGEARSVIEPLDIAHTSFYSGDIIRMNGAYFFMDDEDGLINIGYVKQS